MVLDDPLLGDYLESLGYRLVAQSDRPEQEFTFFLVRDEAINAFAAPGGFVGVNTGLVTTAESESELAAVLAHETAHVTQKHLVRAFESAKNMSIPIMLAMVGALIAANAAGSSDAAQAAVVGGTALMQQTQINFTRHNESEADRIGIGLLARTGFEPDAMATFFGRMSRATRSDGSQNVPDFLKTHPVNTTRISEAKDRAVQIEREVRAVADAPTKADHEAFLLFRERCRVLGTKDPLEALRYYDRTIAASESVPDSIRYGLALAQVRAGHARDAIAGLQELVDAQPDNIAYVLAMAEAEADSGRRDKAIERLAKAASERPGNRAIGIAYSDELVATGDRRQALRAVETMRPLVARTINDLAVQVAYARALEMSGQEVRAGEAHAEVALMNGRFDEALGQLNDLLKRRDIDYYQRARIEARIAQITPIALEQRRREQNQPDEPT
ncbi:MAG TPA: M48 family metalloprotease, partial [Xanthomonadales bacterium]|nr:M48 family metalloprotease [Xanthomonadales bacterium]